MTVPFHRHDRIWLDADADPACWVNDPAQAELARDWVAHGWPLTVARQSDVCPANVLCAGFSLPAAPARVRVGLTIPRGAICRHAGPLTLKEAMTAAPADWLPVMEQAQALCTASGVAPQVYGSLASQFHTQLTHVDDASDLDLLLPCRDGSRLGNLLDCLAALPHAPRLDGEVLLPSGWAVAWRELAAALEAGNSPAVLAKSNRGARLLPLSALRERPLAEAA